MRRFFHFLAVLCLMVLLTHSFLWGKLPDRPFQWADDEAFKPLIYRNSTGKSEGIFYDVLTEAFRRMKIPLRCKLYPWTRAQKMVEEGKADGMVTVATEARRKRFKATDPIVEVEEWVFVSRDNPRYKEILKIRSIKDLKRFTLVETIGSGWSRENFKGMRIIWVPTAQSALNMVASGRADIYLMSNYTGPFFVKEQIRKGGPLHDRLKKIVSGTHPLTKIDYQLLIRKNSMYVDIIDRFNRILRQMYRDGTYGRILQQYRIKMEEIR